MRSQIPACVAAYFEAQHVDTSEHRPMVTAWFRPERGWLPCIHPVPLTHTYLVRIRDHHGVAAVQVRADGHEPDFAIGELVGRMSQLDAEMTDGVPVSQGSRVVAERERIVEVLAAIGVSIGRTVEYLGQADASGSAEFIVREIDTFTRNTLQAWRYLLKARAQIKGGVPGYELRVLVHDPQA